MKVCNLFEEIPAVIAFRGMGEIGEGSVSTALLVSDLKRM